MNSLILRWSVRVLTPPIVVFSLWLLVRGHDAPGGGFIGALAAGAAVVLRYMVHGVEGMRRMLPVQAATLMGAGLVIASGMGFGGLLLGTAFLEGGIVEFQVGSLLEFKATASLVFDVGVYLIVVGMIVAVVHALGEEQE